MRGAPRGNGSRAARSELHSLVSQERLFRRRQLGAVIASREQMPIAIGGDLDRRMPHAGLHHLDRRFEAAVFAAIDAPRGIEMAERVQPEYLADPFLAMTPAAICAGCQFISMIVASVIGRPWLPGNTNPDSLREAASRHSRNALVTIGSNGMQRRLFADFNAPIVW